MFYTRLYKKYYPFHSSNEVMVLNSKEKSKLANMVNKYCGNVCTNLFWYLVNRGINPYFAVKRYGDFYVGIVDKIKTDSLLTVPELMLINHVVYDSRRIRYFS